PDKYPPPKEYPGLDGNPAIGSVDGSGNQWVFVQNDDIPGLFAFDEKGATRWRNTELDGNAGPVVADLNGDGKREVVFVSDGGAVVAYDAATGQRKWAWYANANGANPGSISVSPVVHDLDGDGKKEIFVGARQAVQGSGDWMFKQHAWYFLIAHDGKLLWKRQIPNGAPHLYMHGVPYDVNGDGTKDIIAVDWNTIGHKPGNWEKVGGGNLFALHGKTGEPLWVTALDSTWSNKDIAVADIDDDKQPEILVPTQGPMGGDGIGVYNMEGRQEGWFGITAGWQIARGPVVADLWGDGKLSILLPVYRDGASGCVHQLDVGCREGAIEVWITGSKGKIVDGNNDHFNADRPNAATAAINPRAKASNLTSPEPGKFEEWTGNGTDPDGSEGNGTDVREPPTEGFLGAPAPGVVLAGLGAAGAALLFRRRR
ncbi:MAG TPA: FG-GAP-like repeat-containing protein, partial [Candidatus Thermoplasmatota archaeon]|nr:FG-GAP-like repeat-containing protein [Candidatus Thermoplasmatota archaeon]